MKMNAQQKKALAKLNDAITNLPEFRDLMLMLPSKVAITDCELIECDQSLYFHNNKVKYEGIVPKDKGKHPYLLECCGLEYFESSKSIDELANDIAEAYKFVLSHKEVKPDRIGFHISNYLSEHFDWEKTDEVYPHMRQQAIGGFSLPKVKE